MVALTAPAVLLLLMAVGAVIAVVAWLLAGPRLRVVTSDDDHDPTPPGSGR